MHYNKIDQKLIEDVLTRFWRRTKSAKNCGAISAIDVVNGTSVPKGWKLDHSIDYYLPENIELL